VITTAIAGEDDAIAAGAIRVLVGSRPPTPSRASSHSCPTSASHAARPLLRRSLDCGAIIQIERPQSPRSWTRA